MEEMDIFVQIFNLQIETMTAFMGISTSVWVGFLRYMGLDSFTVDLNMPNGLKFHITESGLSVVQCSCPLPETVCSCPTVEMVQVWAWIVPYLVPLKVTLFYHLGEKTIQEDRKKYEK